MPVTAACAPIQGPDGTLRGAVLVLHDLTLQRTLEAATRRADRLAALGTVTVGLAHEIRNPLGGIKGAAQLLRGGLTDPGLVRATDVIVNEVDRLDGLIEQLREFSRPPQLQLDAVNIHRVLNHVLTLQRQASTWGSVTLRTEFDPSLPAVRGDRAQLTQVFLNLIKNASEALEGRGELVISTQIDSRFTSDAAACAAVCSSSSSRTPAPACPRSTNRTCSPHSSPPSHAAPDSVWPCANASSPSTGAPSATSRAAAAAPDSV